MTELKKQQDNSSGAVSSPQDPPNKISFTGQIDPGAFAKVEKQVDELLKTLIDVKEKKSVKSSENLDINQELPVRKGTVKEEQKRQERQTGRYTREQEEVREWFNLPYGFTKTQLQERLAMMLKVAPANQIDRVIADYEILLECEEIQLVLEADDTKLEDLEEAPADCLSAEEHLARREEFYRRLEDAARKRLIVPETGQVVRLEERDDMSGNEDIQPGVTDDARELVELFNALSKGEQQTLMTLLKAQPEERTEMLALLDERMEEVRLAKLLEEIIRDYTPYPAGQELTSGNIIAHLQSQLGEHLTYFGAPENHIYLDQLRKIEPLIEKINYRLNYEHTRGDDVPHLSDIVPTKTVRMTKKRKMKKYTDGAIKEYQRMGAVKTSRDKRGFVEPTAEAV